jgi:esterase
VAVDLRNHGENTHDLRKQMSSIEMSHDVLAIMDREGMDKCVLVGHSVGGKVSQALSLCCIPIELLDL